MHQKTFYKAALEYSIGHVEKPLDSPIKDTDEFIEKQVLKASEAAARKSSAMMHKAKSQASRTQVNNTTVQSSLIFNAKSVHDSFSLADVASDPKLLRNSQLSQHHVKNPMLPYGPKVKVSQKRLLAPVQKQEKQASSQMLISDQRKRLINSTEQLVLSGSQTMATDDNSVRLHDADEDAREPAPAEPNGNRKYAKDLAS